MLKSLWSRRKKDFEVTWFSGTGAGGQHRNRHMNACRILDKETGLRSESQEFKSAQQNKKAAFKKLVDKLKQYYACRDPIHTPTADFGQSRIRTYNQPNDRVIDEETGDQYSYKLTVGKGNLDKVIEDRMKKKNND